MAEKILVDGNEAIGRGAIQAGCKYFFGYPITPQNEIPEFMSRELPKIGGVFVQSESETASIYMVYGGALAGERVMTSTSSCGFSLMQEGMSYLAEAEMPTVIVNVMRMGPGIGTGGQQGQTDYRQVTKGGGHGAYRCIVLAAWSPQECFDYMQLAFYLAEKYRITVLVLSDFVIGRMAEPVELRTLDFEPSPEKDWALKGKGKKKDKVRTCYVAATAMQSPPVFHKHLKEKYQKIIESEVRYETYGEEDATLLVVSYGSSARMARRAVDEARSQGLKVSLFRPITVWPFPEAALREAAYKAGKVLVVEDSPGELVEDVECVVRAQVPVHLLDMSARYTPGGIGMISGGSGLIYPETILEEVNSLL